MRKKQTAGRINRISTQEMTREQWLIIRRKSISGSDAAGIVGLSHYSSPYSVWANKTGRLPESDDNEAMRQGRDLEEYVAKRWEESTGKKVRRLNAILYNTDYPFAHADIDRAVVGEKAGLECKTTTTLNIRQFHGTDFPEQYYVQCVHYLAVTGFERWYLGVLVLGKGFFSFVLERNQEEINALMQAEKAFWGYVQSDTAPPADGSEATGRALLSVFPQSSSEDMLLFGRKSMLGHYLELKEQVKELDVQLQAIENTIKADLQNCDHGHCGSYTVSWKTQFRRQFQAQSLAAAHPEIDLDPYYINILARPFKVIQKAQLTAVG